MNTPHIFSTLKKRCVQLICDKVGNTTHLKHHFNFHNLLFLHVLYAKPCASYKWMLICAILCTYSELLTLMLQPLVIRITQPFEAVPKEQHMQWMAMGKHNLT